MKYKLLALDVDGTLVASNQLIPPETIDAIAHADAAGLRVCIATGRSYAETMPVWRQLRLKSPYEPMILIGGALVSEPDTGRTLCQRTISHELAAEYAEAIRQAGYSAMAIVDVWRHGVDYYLVESKDAHKLDEMWFSKMKVNVQRVHKLGDAQAMPAALRINAVAPREEAAALSESLQAKFGDRLNIHSIFAPNYGVTVVEAFASTTSKWAAIMYVAQSLRVAPSEIVAVGDDINDLPMIRSAGLGVAMPWAAEPVKVAAKCLAQPDLGAFIRTLVS